jgi:Flp pilus assembly protein TadG
MRSGRRLRSKGTSIIEVTLMAPWLLFLFIGIVDVGFFSYSIISVQNEARAAALYTSISKSAASDQVGACNIVFNEMKYSSYGRGTFPSSCNSTANGLLVTATWVPAAGAGGLTCPDSHDCTRVVVTYKTPFMVPIPGVLPNQMTITRIVTMRVNPDAPF